VGATQNYAWLSPGSKVVLCTLMALGRLEVFAIIVLFSPRFWKGD
jgi:trk system potassium uptake protein TrkH